MKPLAESTIVVERSRFFAVLLEADQVEEINRFIKGQKRKYRKACHHVWACRLKPDEDAAVFEQARDDGEVGRPGHVLLGELQRVDFFGALVVSRIFGGVKLGPGGVSRAFRQAAREVLSLHQGK